VALAFQIAPRPLVKPEKPVRDPAYRRWIKRFACVACGSTKLVDPCHTGPHGLNQKSSDLSCIPLCRKCHDQFDADPKGFARLHCLKIPALIQRFNRLWKQRLEGTLEV
jgi:hypothetical protein